MMRKTRIRTLLADTAGLSTIEYVIILCMIAIVSLAIWVKFGNTVRTKVRQAPSTAGGLPTSSY